MYVRNIIILLGFSLSVMVTSAHAILISSGTSSTKIGGVIGAGGDTYQAYDTSSNLAYSGNGAQVVTSSTIPGYPARHDPLFLNDGFYGNGKSWIGNSPSAWLKIDLGLVAAIDQITFGRDRLGLYDDRDPGQFFIDFALTDSIFSNGDASNDATEYTNVVDSISLGFTGIVSFGETVVIDFENAPVNARYIKMTYKNFGAAIDEVEVFGTTASVAEPGILALLVLGLAGMGLVRRR